MLPVELPTYSKNYAILIRRLEYGDALTLACLAERLGADMLGAYAARHTDRNGFTVCWNMQHIPAWDGPPDMIVSGGRARLPADACAELSFVKAGPHPSCTAMALRRAEAVPLAECIQLYTLGARPYGTADYIASLCGCPAAYVTFGALCRATGFIPVQLVKGLLMATVGISQPNMLSNCLEGACRGYRQLGRRRCP